MDEYAPDQSGLTPTLPDELSHSEAIRIIANRQERFDPNSYRATAVIVSAASLVREGSDLPKGISGLLGRALSETESALYFRLAFGERE